MAGLTTDDFGSEEPDNAFDQILDEAMVVSFGSKNPEPDEIRTRGFTLHWATRGQGYDGRMALMREAARDAALESGLAGGLLASSSTVQPGPEPGQPGEGTGASAAAAPTASASAAAVVPAKASPIAPATTATESLLTAAYHVGDICKTQVDVVMRREEDISSPQVITLKAGVEVEIKEMGTGPTGRRVRVLTKTAWGWEYGWASVVAGKGNVLLKIAPRPGAAVLPKPKPDQRAAAPPLQASNRTKISVHVALQ